MTDTNNNEQVTSSPATQTLFRFVSLRNPQLAKTEGNTKFIFRNNDQKGAFDTMLESTEWAQSGKSKIDFLTDKIKSGNFDFTKVYRSESDLKLPPYLNLYDLTKTLIENGSLTSLQVNGLNAQSLNRIFLWDSLIYQVLTQEDFYLKELLTQMLQTLHYADNYTAISAETNAKKKEAKQKEISAAKVVIPDYLFVDSVPVDSESNVFTVGSSAVGSQDYISGGNTNANALGETQYFPTESMLKRQKATLATYEKIQLEDLKKELAKAQNIYRKQYSKAYDLASKDYQDLIKPLYDDYDQSLLEVEATFTEEMTEAVKKLALSQVVKPEVPEFQFEFRRERDVTFLQSKLSETAFRSFVNLIGEYADDENITGRLDNGQVLPENIVAIGEDQFILPEDENQDFEEMLETINAKLSELSEEIYQNTEVEKQEYVSVGGVLIPINNKTVEKTENKPFNAITIARGGLWSVLLTFDDKSLNIVSGSYQAKTFTSNMTVSDDSISKELNGVFRLFSGNKTLPVNSFQNGFTLIGQFVLSDGQKYDINFTMYRISSTPSSTNTDGYLTGGAALTLSTTTEPNTPGTENPGNPENPGNTNTPASTNNTFVPKGFGIKRLGIADYLKVEQTTHAYVEGEVANIENIMAREYRSQSTRRLRRSETTETSSSDTEREIYR